MEVTKEMIKAFHVAWHKANAEADAPRSAGIAAVLEIVEREHSVALEKRADAAYERGIADVQARFSQEIAEAYARGAKDAQALTELGF